MIPESDQTSQLAVPVPEVASTGLLGHLVLPKRKDVWATPPRRSATARLVLKHAPKSNALKWYPDLPPIGAKIWAVWRNNNVGNAEYLGAWTYKAAREYINEMPVAWHLA